MSPIYRMAKSDPFDGDVRVPTARLRTTGPRRAPVVRLADMDPATAAVLRELYGGSGT